VNQTFEKSSTSFHVSGKDNPHPKISAALQWMVSSAPAMTIAVFFLLISAASVFLCLRQYDAVKARSLNNDRATAEHLALFIREREKAVIGLLQDLAARSSFAAALQAQNTPELRRHLATLKKNPEVDWILILDRKGVIRAREPSFSSAQSAKGSGFKWFQEAVARRGPYTSGVIVLGGDGRTPAIVHGAPVWDENENSIGLLTAVQRIDFLARGFERLPMDPQTRVYVIDGNGHLCFSNRRTPVGDFESPSNTKAVLQALRSNVRQIHLPPGEGASEKYVSLSAAADTRWAVAIEREKTNILRAAQREMIDIVVVAFLLFACLSVFLFFLRKLFLLRQTRKLLWTEIKLRQSQQRLKELFDHMSSGAMILEAIDGGRDFVVTDINAAALDSEKLEGSDVLGRSVCDLFNGVREFGLYDLLFRVWRTGKPEYQAARYFREDRRHGWKQNSVFRLPTGEVVVIFHDISKTKRAEETLKRSEETFAKVFNANPAAMAICRLRDGYLLDVNAAFEHLTGYRREELIGQTAQSLGLWADPREREAMAKTLSQQPSVAHQDVHITTKDGKTLITRYSAETIQLATESCLLSILVDVTAARQAEEEARRLEKQLYESQKMEAIGTLAGGIAHDFNNILGAIIGYAEMAASQSDPKKLQRYADQILAAGLRAKDLVAQILTFSRRHDHNKKPMDLRIITKETLKMLRSTLPSTIDIRVNIPASPFTIDGDPTQMHQIIMNLCTNAAYAMGERGGVLDVGLARQDISLPEAASLPLKPGSYVRLSISDTGCGIDPSITDRIFDPFFTTKKPGEGTGLGLSVAYGIVKNHDGHIRVESSPGRGATFHVYLPSLNLPPSSMTDVSGAEPIPGGQEHILFVDDEKPLVDLARRNLTALGYQVTACSDSLEALKIFKADPDRFDLVITDMTMPHLSGHELSRQMVGLRPGLPIILCTGYSEFINEEKASQLGIKAFLLKPLSRKTMAFAVRRILDETQIPLPRRAEHQG
jgi:PAS domain S-box-containing protein